MVKPNCMWRCAKLSSQQDQRSPFLYIQQPSLKPPEGKMQKTFSTKEAEEKRKQQLIIQAAKEAEQQAANPEKKVKRKNKYVAEELNGETGIFGAPIKKQTDLPSSEEVQEIIAQYDEEKREDTPKETDEQQRSTFRRMKSFREMSIPERLEYLHQFPKQLPPVPCQIQTKANSIRGFLVGKTAEKIDVRLFDKSVISILINDIQAVTMIGFNHDK